MRLLLLLLFCIPFTVNAQNQREERMHAMRIAFLTNKLDLSAQEAQQFWPIYNNYSKQATTINKGEREMFQDLRKRFESLTDAEAQQILDRHIVMQSERAAAREKLIKDLNGVLPPKKILILLKSEEDFKRQIIERLRGGERRQGPGGRRNNRQ